MDVAVNYIKSNLIYPKAERIADTYVIVITRDKLIERKEALLEAVKVTNEING